MKGTLDKSKYMGNNVKIRGVIMWSKKNWDDQEEERRNTVKKINL